MATFVAAWPTANASRLGQFFSEHAMYQNGPMEPVTGRDAIVDSIGQMMAMGGEVDADIINLVSEGPIVMTERVDHVTLGDKKASLRVAGVFEVHDGFITAWRDYFDGNEFRAQLNI